MPSGRNRQARSSVLSRLGPKSAQYRRSASTPGRRPMQQRQVITRRESNLRQRSATPPSVQMHDCSEEDAVSLVDREDVAQFLAEQDIVSDDESVSGRESTPVVVVQPIDLERRNKEKRIRYSVIYPLVSDVSDRYFKSGRVPGWMRNGAAATKAITNAISKATKYQHCTASEFVASVQASLHLLRFLFDFKKPPGQEIVDDYLQAFVTRYMGL